MQCRLAAPTASHSPHWQPWVARLRCVDAIDRQEADSVHSVVDFRLLDLDDVRNLNAAGSRHKALREPDLQASAARLQRGASKAMLGTRRLLVSRLQAADRRVHHDGRHDCTSKVCDQGAASHAAAYVGRGPHEGADAGHVAAIIDTGAVVFTSSFLHPAGVTAPGRFAIVRSTLRL
jgi:hypothetical protein